MQHPGKFRLGQVDHGPCRVELTDENLVIAPAAGGNAYSLYYSDIDRVTDLNHELELRLADGRVFSIYFLGTWYGQCLTDLRLRRGAQLTRNLGMLDAEFQKEFRGAYTFESPEGARHADRAARIALYRTSMVVEPDGGDFWSAAYADIDLMGFDAGRYALDMQLDLGERISFSMLGTRFGELEGEIRRLIREMYERTAAALAGLGLSADAALSLAALLRQGKAVRQERVTALAPGLWPTFAADRQASFEWLRSVAAELYVGFREAFSGGKPVYWYVAVFPEQGAMAVEVPSEEGNATYVYRLDGPPERSVARLSRAMVALNFRREVISCSDAELNEGRMSRYRVAVRKLEYVRRLRGMFIGKAAHTEGWQRRVEELLARGRSS
ncbi:MAG TPA: hypothetical protein VD969_26655 [Symbiobacteriaceae bacterium]|nr:hypothetical protein [Symbiobacteriaceae bacterium]